MYVYAVHSYICLLTNILNGYDDHNRNQKAILELITSDVSFVFDTFILLL